MKSLIKKFKKFKKFIGQEVWRLFVFSILIGFLTFLVESSFIFVFQGFFSTIGFMEKTQTQLPGWYPTEGVLPILALLFFGFIRGCVLVMRQTVGGKTSLAFMASLRIRLIKQVLQNSENLNNAEVINLFSERINHSGSVLQGISQIILVGVSAFFLFILGFKLAPFEMIICIFLSAVMMLPLRRLNIIIGNLGDESRRASDETLSSLYSGLRNNLFLKVHGLIGQFIETASQHLLSYRRHYEKYYFIGAIRNFSPNVIGVFVLCGVTILETMYLKNLSSVQFISFFYLFMRFAQAASDININFSEIKLLWGSFKQVYSWVIKIDEIADQPSVIVQEKSCTLKLPLKIMAHNLRFSYEGYPELFKDLCFNIQSGELLLIKGKSGSGKSTLIKLLLGLLSPQSGAITVNSLPIATAGADLRRSVGYVGPEPYIISGTIRQNLMFGNELKFYPDSELMFFLSKVGLQNEIKNLDLLISESDGLSTGQKQRLSFARALIRKPKILILDEATANLDALTESIILRTIKNELKDLLIVAISHKDSFDELATVKINLTD